MQNCSFFRNGTFFYQHPPSFPMQYANVQSSKAQNIHAQICLAVHAICKLISANLFHNPFLSRRQQQFQFYARLLRRANKSALQLFNHQDSTRQQFVSPAAAINPTGRINVSKSAMCSPIISAPRFVRAIIICCKIYRHPPRYIN